LSYIQTGSAFKEFESGLDIVQQGFVSCSKCFDLGLKRIRSSCPFAFEFQPSRLGKLSIKLVDVRAVSMLLNSLNLALESVDPFRSL